MKAQDFTLHCKMCDGKPFAIVRPELSSTTEELQGMVAAAIDFHIDIHTTRLMVEIEEVLSGQEPH